MFFKTLPRIIILLLLTGWSTMLYTQVRGVSWTLAPAANYTWFNAQSGLDEAFLIGGRLGIGFGEYVELRASYLQTINQTIDLGAFEVDEMTLDSRDVDLARYGADLRLNLSKGNLLPYVLIGAGVQDIGRDGLENSENIFATAGLGLTLTAADRFSFTVEGKNIAYSYNSVRNLLNEAERTANDLDLEDSQIERFGNWSVEAGLQFYLGGRNPGELSEVDRAYLNAFGNGFRGLRLPLEVNLARVDWNDKLPYRDAWLGGANIGVDIGPFIGLRAFYLRGMEDDDVSLNFEDFALYGGDVRLNLSRAGRGFTPFLTLGGGYIDVGQDYVIDDEEMTAQSQGFATGGAGLSLGLGDLLRLNGSAKALLTTTSDFENLNSTDQLTTSWMYTAGLTFAFGNRAEPQEVAQAKTQQAVDAKEREMQAQLDQQRQENQRQARELKRRYEQRIADLEQQLNQAYEDQDVDRAADLMREKEDAEMVVAEIERREDDQRRRDLMRDRARMDSIDHYYPSPDRRYARYEEDRYTERRDRSEGMVRMTPEQLTELIEAAGGTQRAYSDEEDRYAREQDRDPQERRFTTDREWMEERQNERDQRYQELNQRLRRIEQQMRSTQRSGMPGADQQRREQQRPEDSAMRDSLDRQLKRLQDQVEKLQKRPASDNQQADEELRRQLNDMRQEIRQLREYRDRYDDRRSQWRNELDEQSRENRELRRQVDRDITEYMANLKNELRDIRDRQEEQADRLDDLAENSNRMDRAGDDDDRYRRDRAEEPMRTDPRPRVKTMDEIDPQLGGTYILTPEEDTLGLARLIRYSGMSGFAGFNIGDNSNNTLNFGLRWHYLLGNTGRFEMMPEAFFGIGEPVNFGLSVNGLVHILPRGFIRPYLGAGFGFLQRTESQEGVADKTDFRPAFNIIAGTYFDVLGGRLYADFMGRNFFNNNQIVAGYRFTF